MRHLQNKVAWALVIAVSLLVLASQTDVARGGSLAPAAPDASYSLQTGCVLPGPLSLADDDCDDFSNLLELHVGTLPLLPCGIGGWPADITNDRSVTGADLNAIASAIGGSIPPAAVRLDIAPESSGDNAVSGGDLSAVASRVGQSCQPVDPV